MMVTSEVCHGLSLGSLYDEWVMAPRDADASEPRTAAPATGAHASRLLVFWEGGSTARDLPSDKRVVIGRAPDCDVRVEHPSVSRHHAVVHPGSPARIEDLGSSNGTVLAGRRLAPNELATLQPGALVEVGDVLMVLQPAHAAGTAAGVERSRSAIGSDSSREEAMARIQRLVDTIAPSKIPIVLLGETGVGKGVLAESIHERSPRAQRPFVRIHCAALPEALIESELFGHERGSFTGAVQAKAGLLESADGGTVFLDEVGDIPLSAQVKLLHVLEHDEVVRVGSLRPRAIDVRFVAATNRNLDELVAEGKFRRDLLFRLSGEMITIPPLRERPREIPSLARGFVAEASASIGKPPPGISGEALSRLIEHGWPGNVRELRNVMVRAALLCTGPEIGLEHLPLDRFRDTSFVQGPAVAATLPPPPEGPRDSGRLRGAVRDVERARIVEALERFAGSQVETAKHLGISRRTLLNRLDEFGLPRPRKRGPPKSR